MHFLGCEITKKLCAEVAGVATFIPSGPVIMKLNTHALCTTFDYLEKTIMQGPIKGWTLC